MVAAVIGVGARGAAALLDCAYFPHWCRVPAGFWRWPNFTPREIASHGNGSLLVVFDALDALQRARSAAGWPFIVNSGFRDPAHNRRVGGEPDSFHLYGQAFDIALGGHDKAALFGHLQAAGFRGFGLSYKTFIHADIGPARTW